MAGMAVFLIIYDLRKPDFDYEPLYAVLAEMNATRLQTSLWGVNTTSTADEVFERLWPHLNGGVGGTDRLLVMLFNQDGDYKTINSMNRLMDL